MLKKELAPGIIRYGFEPLSRHRFGTNIYALVSGEDVMLIDAGYAFQAEQALSDISRCGQRVGAVVVSHFHDDHMEGLKLLPGVAVYGSEQYNVSLDLWTKKEEHRFYRPTVLVKDTLTIDFGEHTVSMTPFPGHSPCTLLTLLDGKYLHIADELIFSEQGEPVLPVSDPGCVRRHADALQRLKSYDGCIFLPAHGPQLCGRDNILRDINNRLAYYSAILDAGREITYEEAVKDCDRGFLHSEWHANVYE